MIKMDCAADPRILKSTVLRYFAESGGKQREHKT